MININVKHKQNGEITSNIKEVTNIYATFVRYDILDNSFENVDLQQRLNPINTIVDSDSILSPDSTIDSRENVYLQKCLYQDLTIDVPKTNVVPYKIVQIWTVIDKKIKNIFSLISSCFGSGIWMSAEKWDDTELWK